MPHILVLSVVVSESRRRVLTVRDLNARSVVRVGVSRLGRSRFSRSSRLGRRSARLGWVLGRRSRSLGSAVRRWACRSRGSRRARRRLLGAPRVDDGGQDSPARAGRLDVNVGGLVRSSLEVLVERTSVTGVEEDGRVATSGSIPRTDVVAGVLADEVEDVGTDVEAAKSVKVPVGLDGGDLGVVVVVVGVSGADKLLGNSVTEKQAEDAVTLGVSLALVESDENEGAAPEVGLLVVDERLEEITAPLAGNGDGGVVSIAGLYDR